MGIVRTGEVGQVLVDEDMVLDHIGLEEQGGDMADIDYRQGFEQVAYSVA